MASGLPAGVVLLCLALAPAVYAGDRDCKAYTDLSSRYYGPQKCMFDYCCGTCQSRYCCSRPFQRLTEDDQDECNDFTTSFDSSLSIVLSVCAAITFTLVVICCCVCPCCCIYKTCRKPQPVVATTTTTVTMARPYPQQPTSGPGHPYQGPQYPTFHHMPVQPGSGYGPAPYPGQPFVAGPPPTYQEATGPSYPPQPMPYSSAAFTPGQQPYPTQPPMPPPPPQQQQPNHLSPTGDFLAQPAFNPDFVAPPRIG